MRMNTRNYENMHGRKPRGTATWWFEIMFTNGNGAYSSEQICSWGTLTEARQSAVRQIKRTCGEAKHIVEVEVLP